MFLLYKDICSTIEIEILNFDKLYHFIFYLIDINYIFQLASYNGHYKIIKYLLTKNTPKVDQYDEDNYAFKAAVMEGHYKIVKYILLKATLKIDSNIDKLNETVDNFSLWAYKSGDYKMYRILSKHMRHEEKRIFNLIIK
jgi:hypothetical protein